MKKVSLCIGVFIVLFLAIGVHTAKAQDLSGLNGQWLNGALKVQKGWVTANGTAGAPEKMQNSTEKFYACVRAGGASATLFMFNKEGNPIADFTATIGWIAGTNDDFVGSMNIDRSTHSNFGFVHVKDGKFQSINGYSAYSDVNGFTTYDFTFNGKILKKVSPDLEAVGCATYTP
jgi:hypothetical protein